MTATVIGGCAGLWKMGVDLAQWNRFRLLWILAHYDGGNRLHFLYLWRIHPIFFKFEDWEESTEELKRWLMEEISLGSFLSFFFNPAGHKRSASFLIFNNYRHLFPSTKSVNRRNWISLLPLAQCIENFLWCQRSIDERLRRVDLENNHKKIRSFTIHSNRVCSAKFPLILSSLIGVKFT
ncbi:hypothetical protein NE237_028557 [Protea cynaroides]|uniref:Uncharacterized protein n=1 Tax=Protea cynaroides TaxID=273540 RepID=A0A9Q0JV92_9MAGN|nr:hypothetical protein NE237_028557 [Protea cynaroides]